MNMLAAELPVPTGWISSAAVASWAAKPSLRGASQVVAVEQDRRVSAIARSNLETVASGLEPRPTLRVVQQEVLRWLRPPREGFDVVYADPPYAAGLYEPLLERLAAGEWLRPHGLVLLEHATKNPPELPAGWEVEKQKRYGSCSLVMLSRC